MKYLLTILFFGQFFVTWGQKPADDNNSPFQIIFAEHVENIKGQKINNLDLISMEEVLTIRQGGLLSMMHHSGLPLEIEGDTTIKIKDLQREFDLLKRGKKKRKYDYLSRPNIDYLFIADGKMGRKNKLAMNGVCNDCNFDLEIIYPPKYRANEILFSNDLCLTWQSTGSTNYEIKLENLYGDHVKTYTSTTNELKIAAAEIQALIDKEEEGLLLAQIKDITTNKISVQTFIRKFPSGLIEFSFACDPRKATHALIAGMYLEMSPRNYMKEAEQYFRLATELSDKEFFKAMLVNFSKRRE